MNEWSKEQLEEMFGDDVVEQLAFLAGCTKHRLVNDPAIPDGWIVPDEVLKKFAEVLLEEMYDFIMDESAKDNGIPDLGTVKQHFGVKE